jgi:hypothetical protein
LPAVDVHAKHAIDARSANTEPARDRRRPKPFLATQTKYLNGIDRRLATFIDAASLGGIDPL